MQEGGGSGGAVPEGEGGGDMRKWEGERGGKRGIKGDRRDGLGGGRVKGKGRGKGWVRRDGMGQGEG